MRAMGVVRVHRHGPLDLRPGGRELPVLGQRHGMVGQEPGIVAVMRREAVHQHGDRVLLPEAAGGADQAVGVGGRGQHQRVARPGRQMLVQGGDRGVGLAREHQLEERDVTGLARRQAGGELLAAASAARAASYVALPQQDLRLAGMGQGEAGIGGDGAVVGLDRARIEGQRPVAALDIGVPRGGGSRGQRQVISV